MARSVHARRSPLLRLIWVPLLAAGCASVLGIDDGQPLSLDGGGDATVVPDTSQDTSQESDGPADRTDSPDRAAQDANSADSGEAEAASESGSFENDGSSSDSGDALSESGSPESGLSDAHLDSAADAPADACPSCILGTSLVGPCCAPKSCNKADLCL